MLTGTSDAYLLQYRVNNRWHAVPVNNGRTAQRRCSPPQSRQPRSTDASHPSPASVLAAEIKALVEAGDRDAARERFGALVALLQRRAVRIAFQYLRDAADADEAVQDAFVKVFLHIDQYRERPAVRRLVYAHPGECGARPPEGARPAATLDQPLDRRRHTAGPSSRCRPRRVARAAPAGEGTVGAGHAGRRRPARSSAAGVHALPPRRADAGGNQRRDGHEPGARCECICSGVAEVARSAGRSAHEPTRRAAEPELSTPRSRRIGPPHARKPTPISTNARSRSSGTRSCSASRTSATGPRDPFPHRHHGDTAPRRRRQPPLDQRRRRRRAHHRPRPGQLLHLVPGDNWVNRDTAIRPTAAVPAGRLAVVPAVALTSADADDGLLGRSRWP